MPRASAEGRAGAALRSGAVPPAAPLGLGVRAAEIWRAVVAAKPADWFDAGALPLLRQYCVTAAQAEAVDVVLSAADPADPLTGEIEKRLVKLNGSCTTLATKLRLSVQAAVDRRSGMLGERGPGEEAAADPLLGGKVVPLRAV